MPSQIPIGQGGIADRRQHSAARWSQVRAAAAGAAGSRAFAGRARSASARCRGAGPAVTLIDQR